MVKSAEKEAADLEKSALAECAGMRGRGPKCEALEKRRDDKNKEVAQ